MTSLNDTLNGGLDPTRYDPAQVAGFGTSIYDHEDEPRQPRGWQAGEPPSWCAIWLGVE